MTFAMIFCTNVATLGFYLATILRELYFTIQVVCHAVISAIEGLETAAPKLGEGKSRSSRPSFLFTSFRTALRQRGHTEIKSTGMMPSTTTIVSVF